MSIEKLKAAHEATPKGTWLYQESMDAVVRISSQQQLKAVVDLGKIDNGDLIGEFVALAHNMMPALLETVELLKVALHALETPGDFTAEELREQVIGDIARQLALLEPNEYDPFKPHDANCVRRFHGASECTCSKSKTEP